MLKAGIGLFLPWLLLMYLRLNFFNPDSDIEHFVDFGHVRSLLRGITAGKR
jgi:hypothetical protein